MKKKPGSIAIITSAILAGAWLAGCGSVSSPSAGALNDGNLPAKRTVQIARLVDLAGQPVAGVVVLVYPALPEKSFRAGVTDDKGEILLPIKENADYLFTRNGQTLLGQTAVNLFSLGPSAPHFYRYDGAMLILPLNLTPTVSPLVSPVSDPLSTAPPATPPFGVGK